MGRTGTQPQGALHLALPYLLSVVGLSECLPCMCPRLPGCSGFSDLAITYSSPRGDDLDTRLLRANVLKVGGG
jgi:D-3-phosphoglycerate dehydrogenase